MADFWAGVAKGFAPSYESALARREREEKEAKAEKARDAAAALAAAKVKEDLRRWEAEQKRASSAVTESERRWDVEQEAKKSKVDLDKQIREKADEQKMEDIRGKLMLTGTPQQQEGLMGIGGVPMRGLEPGMDARTLGPTPEELQGLKRGELVQAQMRATDLQKKKDEAEAKMQPTYQAPKLPTPPTLHARVEELVKIINSPDSTPPEKAEAQKTLDVLKPPAAGRAPTTIEKREEYLNTLNDPDASLEQKQFAQSMIDQLGGETTEVYGPEGQLLFRTGKARTGAQKDPQPSSLSNALLDIKGLQRGFNPDKPSVGWIATAKNVLGDKILPQIGITAFSDAQRVAYRQAVKEFKVAYVKALNAPDSRLSDMDRKMLEPLAPNENDSPFEFQEKLNTVERKVRLHQKFNTAFAGKKDPVWTMGLREVLDARKVSPVTGKATINDELAAFALQESHGLKGVTQIQWMANVQELARKKEIDEDELRFLLKSVLQGR